MGVLILVSGFFGSYLGIPGNEGLFLFRLLVPIHLAWYLLYEKKIWNGTQKTKYILGAYVCFFVGMSLTLFWTSDLIESVRYLYFLFEWLYVFYICVYCLKEKDIFDQFCQIMILLYALFLVIGVSESLTGWHLPQSGSLVYQTTTSRYQPTGFLFNTNDFASLLALFFPFVWVRVQGNRKKSVAWIGGGALFFLTFYLILITNSRLALLSFGISVFILGFSWLKGWSLLIWYTVASGAAFLATLGQASMTQSVVEQIKNTFFDKGGSTADRVDMYQVSWELIKDSYFMGLGAGNLPLRLDEYMYGFERISDNYWAPHNYWLEALANGGAIPFMCLLVCFYLYMQESVKQWWGSNFTAESAVPLLILVAFLAASIGLSSSIDKVHLAIGLGLGLHLLNTNSVQKEKRVQKMENEEWVY